MAKSKVFKNCLALLLITLVAGLALAVVNEITAKPISEAENKAKMAAYESVFSGVEFEEINSSDKLIKAENDSAPVQNASVDDVLRAGICYVGNLGKRIRRRCQNRNRYFCRR